VHEENNGKRQSIQEAISAQRRKTFTEIIDELIRENVKKHAEMITSLSTKSLPEEYVEAVKLVKEGLRARHIDKDT
jgi:L-fucose isomerase-like protein